MGLESYVRRWNLTPDGEPIHTHSSDLLPVRFRGEAAMLKVARSSEERTGNALMVWLGGDGAARVLHHGGKAVVMERVEGDLNLTAMVYMGQDDEATQILCRAAAAVHRDRGIPLPNLPFLGWWFKALQDAAQNGGLLQDAWATARALLASQQDVRPLHGDIHHGNVLHSRERGWLVIDPKGLIGERGFDYANIFCNPDLEVATAPGRLARQAHVVAEAAGLERHRLLQWVLAYAGLSAAWHLEDGEDDLAAPTLEVARIAAAELGPG